jgi:hypothetical protein
MICCENSKKKILLCDSHKKEHTKDAKARSSKCVQAHSRRFAACSDVFDEFKATHAANDPRLVKDIALLFPGIIAVHSRIC